MSRKGHQRGGCKHPFGGTGGGMATPPPWKLPPSLLGGGVPLQLSVSALPWGWRSSLLNLTANRRLQAVRGKKPKNIEHLPAGREQVSLGLCASSSWSLPPWSSVPGVQDQSDSALCPSETLCTIFSTRDPASWAAFKRK